MFYRLNQLLLCILIGLSVLQNIYWLAIMLSLVFTLYYGGVWLIVLAMGIDAYFGAFADIPIFSLVSLVWFIVSELLKLRLRITREYE